MVDQHVALKILLAEYERLKEEQRVRIGVRDNLIYATLASLAGVVVATVTGRGHPDLLLLATPICLVLGWTYLANDQKVSAIGRYLRTELAPSLTTLTPGVPVLGWETSHRTDPRRTSRKLLQLAVDLLTFCLPGLAAVTLHWRYGHQDRFTAMVGGDGPMPPQALGAVPADLLLVDGDPAGAERGYLAMIANDPGSVAGWSGLAIASASNPTRPWRVIVRRPELVRAVYREACRQASPSPIAIAAWLDRAPIEWLSSPTT